MKTINIASASKSKQFCRLFTFKDGQQLLIMLITMFDKSIIEEITVREDTMIKNCVDFEGENHKEKAIVYMKSFDMSMAKEQFTELNRRIEGFLDPNSDKFLDPNSN
jgi:hypothetical protein